MNFRPEAMTSSGQFPMAVAWIAYRDLEEVRKWSADYRGGSEHSDVALSKGAMARNFDGPILMKVRFLEQPPKPSAFPRWRYTENGPTRRQARNSRSARTWRHVRHFGPHCAMGFWVASGIDLNVRRWNARYPPSTGFELEVCRGPEERVDEVRREGWGSGYEACLASISSCSETVGTSTRAVPAYSPH